MRNDNHDQGFPVHPGSSASPPAFTNMRPQTPPQNLSFYETTAYNQQNGLNGNMNTMNSAQPNPGYNNYGQFNPADQGMGFGQGGFGQGMGQQFGGLINNPAANLLVGMGMNSLNNALGDNVGRYKGYFEGLKMYFNVDNRYVLQKLRLLLLPYTNKSWERKGNQPQDETFSTPRDPNEPDLYIPFMAFLTYILLTCYIMGIENRFTPDLLAATASTSIFVNLIEISLVKLGFYILSVPTNIPFLDMCAYSGYKYVGIVLSIFAGNIFGGVGYFPMLAFTSIGTCYFMVKTLRRAGVQNEDSSLRVRFDHNTAKRNYFVVIVALLQPLFMFFLSYSYSNQFVFSSLFAAAGAKSLTPINDGNNALAPANEPVQDKPAEVVEPQQNEVLREEAKVDQDVINQQPKRNERLKRPRNLKK
ncbi:yif1b-b [Acrasis kona]|uniref:Yif1b-b n=1 Tax=Acrasis kona TaxID=1008807 RepID=A0AAW2YHK5_9EUKA